MLTASGTSAIIDPMSILEGFRNPLKAALAGVMLAALAPVHAGVVVSEIMYHPASDDSRDEFVELYNPGATFVTLQDWCFSGIDFCFPPRRLDGSGPAHRAGGRPGAIPGHLRIRDGPRLPGPAEQRRRSGSRCSTRPGQVVDEVEYSDLPPWPVTPDGLGPSLEVVDPTEDNASPRNWRASVDPDGHTAGGTNSVAAAGLPPWISDVSHTVDVQPSDPIVITATVQGRRLRRPDLSNRLPERADDLDAR